MKSVFLDTNILIDCLSHRQPFYQNAAYIITSCEEKGYRILISALSFATASYLLETHYKKSPDVIKALFDDFVRACSITPVDSLTVNESIASNFTDFEDAMQYYSALREGADLIITRNKDDYKAAQIPVYETQEYLDLLTNH